MKNHGQAPSMERKLISEPRQADADEVLELPHEMPPAGEFGSNLIFLQVVFYLFECEMKSQQW